MAEITTTATDVQIQNQFDSDMIVTLIAEPSRTFNNVIDSADYTVVAAYNAGSRSGSAQYEFWEEEA